MPSDASRVWFTELVEQQIRLFGSQAALADELGTSQQTISNWKNKGTKPDPLVAVKFAALAGIDPVELVGRLFAGDGPPDGDDSPTTPGGAKGVAATVAELEQQIADQRELLAELGRHVAEMPAAHVEEWSGELRQAALGGDVSKIKRIGKATSTKPKLGSFDPDEHDPADDYFEE